MPRRFVSLLGWLSLTMLVGCSEEVQPVLLDLQVLSPAAGSCSGELAPVPLDGLGAATLRLTLLRGADSGAPGLECDRVVQLGGGAGHADLELKPDDSQRLDLLVEAFSGDAPPRLLASGQLVDIARRPRIRPLKLLLVPTGSFSCAATPQRTPRAFHSATTLPDGRVLLLGGLTHQAGGGLTALDSGELFEPRTGRFVQASGKLSQARAMHSALLLGGPAGGPYDLLLAGGVAPAKPGAAVVQWNGGADPLPLVPAAGAVAADSAVVRVYPGAEPPRIEELAASPRLQQRMFHARASTADGEVLLLGGLSGYSAGRLSTVDSLELLPSSGDTAHEGPFPLQRARVGAAAAGLGSGGVLVFGGNLDSPGDQLVQQAAELVTVSSDKQASSKTLTLESGSAGLLQSTAFSTLTPLGQDSLLLVGGLRVEAAGALTPRSTKPVQRLSLVSGELRVSDVTSTGFVPVAWHAAVALPDQSVLVVGGMGASGACAAGQRACERTWRFDDAAGTLSPDAPLRTARMGHRLSWIPGDILLVSGGLSVSDAGALQALDAAELAGEGHRGQDPFGRAPGQAGPGSSCK